MKTYALYGINDLRMEERAVPSPGENQVLVQVKAVGICGSDIPRIFQTGTYSFPTVPGHEFSGVVAAVGTGVKPEWVGRRVGVFPLIPCRKCTPCRQKHYELCRNYSYLGSRTDGGFAEYVLVPEASLIELPDSVSFEAAAMLEPMAVAVHALRRAQINQDRIGTHDLRRAQTSQDRMGAPALRSQTNQDRMDAVYAPSPAQAGPGKTAAVYGQGTIGLLLSMFLKEAGMERVLAIGNKDQQKRSAMDMGIAEEDFCDTRIREPGAWLAERTDGAGADIFFECIGKSDTISAAIELTAPMGTVVLVGNPYGNVSLDKAVYWKILRNQLTVRGCWNSSFTQEKTDDWHYVLERLEQGRIQPERLITHLFPFEQLSRGLEIMRDKKEEYLKVMIKI